MAAARTIHPAHRSRVRLISNGNIGNVNVKNSFYGSPIDNWMIICSWQHRVKLRFADRQFDIKKCYEMLRIVNVKNCYEMLRIVKNYEY